MRRIICILLVCLMVCGNFVGCAPSGEALPPVLESLRTDGVPVPALDAPITNQLFWALLVKEFGWTLESDLSLAGALYLEEPYAAYGVTAYRRGVVAASVFPYGERNAVGSDLVVWMRRAVGVQIGLDDWFASVPQGAVTVREAIALIESVRAQYDRIHALREDASNTLVLQETVRVTYADNGKNRPYSMNEATSEIVFDDPDDTVRALQVGDVLYIPYCEAYPNGLLTKVSAVRTQDGRVAIICEAPSVGEVIKEADISTEIAVGGRTQNGTVSGLSFEHLNGDLQVNSYATENGHNWSVFGSLGEQVKFHAETPSFKTKEGGYASVDLSAVLRVNANIVAEGMHAKTFLLAASVDSKIGGVIGYKKALSPTKVRVDVATVTVPVSGPLSVELTAYLYVTASGEFEVEFIPTLSTTATFGYAKEKGPFGGITSTFTMDGTLKAQGQLEDGIGMDAEFGLNGVPFVDGLHLLETNVEFGVGLRAETEVNVHGGVSSDGSAHLEHNAGEYDDGSVHNCDYCVKAEMYCVDYLELRPDKQLYDWLKETVGVDAKLSFGPTEAMHTPYYYSVRSGQPAEWEKGYCPHKAYKVTVNAKVRKADNHAQNATEKPLGGVKVVVGDETGITDGSGCAILYVEPGTYTFSATKGSGYRPESHSEIVTIRDEQTLNVSFEQVSMDYYEFIQTVLVPEHGLSSMAPQTITQNVDEFFSGTKYDGWDERHGLVGADTADLNNDGVEDLLVYHFASVATEWKGEQSILCVSIYTRNDEDQIVQVVDSFDVGAVSDSDKIMLFLGLKQIEGKTYLFREYSSRMNFVDGYTHSIVLYGFDQNGEWTSLYTIRKSAGGTSEIAYSLSDKVTGETILIYADGGYRAFHEEADVLTESGTTLPEAVCVALQRIGWDVQVDELENENGFCLANQPDVRKGVFYTITFENSGFKDYEYTASLKDYTELRNYITES